MTENGWPPDTRAHPGVSMPRDQMDDNPVPGTSVRIPLQRGIPNTIMKAFAADFNMHVEPLNNGRGRNDEGGWTPRNDVSTSNHLGGTAMDLNWSDHAFRVHNAGFDEHEIAITRELLAFYEDMIFWGNDWENPRDSMHFQMGYHTFDNIPKCEDFIRRKILSDGFSLFRRSSPPPRPASPAPVRESYGLPAGSNSGGYGGSGVKFPDWVYQLGNAFGIKPSTYPGHQETDRNEAGYAPNPQHLNRAIDWAAPGDPGEVDKLTRFADYLATIPQYLEQVIWQNPRTMRSIEVAGGRHQPGYFAADLAGHRNHVHTRQSASIPLPGAPPPQPQPPPRAEILARAVGLELDKAQSILVGVVNGLRTSQCTNVNRIAMWLAQMGHESANFKATEEFASGEAYNNRPDLGNTQPGDGPRFKGRTWIQITGRSNYTQLSKWAFSNGIVPAPTYFVDNPVKLAEMQYAGLGPAWYWTVARPQINSLCDKSDVVGVTQAINGGQHGITDRRNRWNRALALGNELLTLTTGVEPPPTGEDDFLSALSAQEQRDLYDAIMNKRQSRSPLRHVGEGQVGDAMDQIWDIDGNLHLLVVGMLASLKFPDPEAVALLQEVAGADVSQFPERQRDKKLARAILAGLGAPSASTVQVMPAPVSMPPVNYPEPEVLPAIRTTAPVKGNTPEDLLDTIDRLNVFRRDFDKRFDALTAEKPQELEEGK